jgi:hypothetical protein
MEKNKECLICYESKNLYPIPPCDHTFCNGCLKDFFISEIAEKKFPIVCPGISTGEKNKCKNIIETLIILEQLDDKMKDKYINFTLHKVFEDFPDKLSWCPTPGCIYGFEITPNISKFECPQCKKSYCLQCKVEYHKGITCDKFKKENNKDDQFVKYAKSMKFKQCPKCRFWVDKIDGCNHMKCKCKNEFCYICGKNWGLGHVCNLNARIEENNDNNRNINERQISENRNIDRDFERLIAENRNLNYYDSDSEGSDSTLDLNVYPQRPVLPSNRQNQTREHFTTLVDTVNNDLSYRFPNRYTFKPSKSNGVVRKNDGTLDMRYMVNKESVQGIRPFQRNNINLNNTIYISTFSEGPKKNDGTLDMRYSVNKEQAVSSSRFATAQISTGPTKKDGTLDMRYSVNKHNIHGINSQSHYPSSSTYISSGPTKKDGTLDMRYSVNKQSSYGTVSQSHYPSTSAYMSSGPTKKDGTLDMRYSVNKGSQSSYGYSNSSSYQSGGGPRKKDGTLDMRYSVNKRK